MKKNSYMNELIFSLFSKYYLSFSTNSGMPLLKKKNIFLLIYIQKTSRCCIFPKDSRRRLIPLPPKTEKEKRGEIGEEEAYLLTTTSGQYCRGRRQRLSKPQTRYRSLGSDPGQGCCRLPRISDDTDHWDQGGQVNLKRIKKMI